MADNRNSKPNDDDDGKDGNEKDGNSPGKKYVGDDNGDGPSPDGDSGGGGNDDDNGDRKRFCMSTIINDK